MDPDGTIYYLINLIINVILCLYIATIRQNEDREDFDIGVSKNFVSAIILLLLNFSVLLTFTLSDFDFWWQCIFGALFVFLGTLLPYCIGLAQHDKMMGIGKILAPILFVLNYSITFVAILPVQVVFKLFKFNTDKEVTQQDVMDLVEDASDDIIDDERKEMIENIFELDDIAVSEIMTHRTEVFAVDQEESCINIIESMREEGFSRVPVYAGTIDTIVGVLYAKDLLTVLGDETKLNASVQSLIRKPMFVPKSCSANDLLVQFKLKRTQLAVVVDEYGGTSGIITMEDILEEIVGNIQDEYDNEEEEFQQIDAHCIICKSSMDIEDALERLGIEVEDIDEDDDFDTVGGLIIDRLARIPQQNEEAQVIYMGAMFTVLEVADRRIIKVKVERLQENP